MVEVLISHITIGITLTMSYMLPEEANEVFFAAIRSNWFLRNTFKVLNQTGTHRKIYTNIRNFYLHVLSWN